MVLERYPSLSANTSTELGVLQNGEVGEKNGNPDGSNLSWFL